MELKELNGKRAIWEREKQQQQYYQNLEKWELRRETHRNLYHQKLEGSNQNKVLSLDHPQSLPHHHHLHIHQTLHHHHQNLHNPLLNSRHAVVVPEAVEKQEPVFHGPNNLYFQKQNLQLYGGLDSPPSLPQSQKKRSYFSSPSSNSEKGLEHARLPQRKMVGNQRQPSSRLGGLKVSTAIGKIAKVHGGRIVQRERVWVGVRG